MSALRAELCPPGGDRSPAVLGVRSGRATFRAVAERVAGQLRAILATPVAESPLAQLVNSTTILSTFTEETFYGRDRVGNEISVTGTVQIEFGNFGDT